MSKRAQLIIVSEDLQQDYVARHYFMARGFDRHKIRSYINPKGEGAGEQYVRQKFVIEVKAYRQQANHLDVRLAVMIDADNFSVAERYLQLDKELEQSNHPKRQPTERIAIFVPKRNIETWIHYLQGEQVDEETVYRRLTAIGECKQYVHRFATEIRPQRLPDDAPASLHEACKEVTRIM